MAPDKMVQLNLLSPSNHSRVAFTSVTTLTKPGHTERRFHFYNAFWPAQTEHVCVVLSRDRSVVMAVVPAERGGSELSKWAGER
jgi:hypothetical protein